MFSSLILGLIPIKPRCKSAKLVLIVSVMMVKVKERGLTNEFGGKVHRLLES